MQLFEIKKHLTRHWVGPWRALISLSSNAPSYKQNSICLTQVSDPIHLVLQIRELFCLLPSDDYTNALTAATLALSMTLVYLTVVVMLSWPIKSAIFLREISFSLRAVPKECRRTCGL